MAFTSWLVVASMALTSAALLSEKPLITLSISASVVAENGATSPIFGSAARALSHSSSTRTRAFIKPYSEKIGRSGAVVAA